MHRIPPFRALICAVIGALAASSAAAQESPDVPASELGCPPRQIRWQDDCANLGARPLAGLERLKYMRIPAGYASFGGEARVRLEHVDALDFGVAGARRFDAAAYRFLAHASVYGPEGFRLFGQVVANDQSGRRPARAADRDHIDLAQFFVEAEHETYGHRLTARLGRQELDVSGNRLVGLREGATVRRAFQGVVLEDRVGPFRGLVFDTRPVLLSPGFWDDRADPHESFRGASFDLRVEPRALATAFFFDRDRPARPLPGAQSDRRLSYGARYTFNGRRWSGNIQAAHQSGHEGPLSIDAWGGAGGLYYRPPQHRELLLGVTAAYASGDADPADRKAGGFDPLYPNAYGLSDAPFFAQTNFLLLGASAVLRRGWIEPGLSAFVVSRADTGDGVYSQGRAIPGVGGEGHHSATLLQASARLRFRPRLEIYNTLVKGYVGDALRRAGARDPLYFRSEFIARF